MTMIDPTEIDWREASDQEVALSARAGIAPAIDEAKRRGLDY